MKINKYFIAASIILAGTTGIVWYHQHTIAPHAGDDQIHLQASIPEQATLPAQVSQNMPQKAAPGQTASATKSIKKAIRTAPHINAPRVVKKDPLYWDWSTIDTQQIYFPDTFLWGAATSAQQVEGNCTNNDWNIWEQNHADTKTGIACDQWNRYTDDIQLLKKIGLNSYCFSIEWSKIEPQRGIFDEDALEHYEDLCKELIKQGIKPIITLHHYTNPLWFTKLGGFEHEKNICHFIRYCKKVFERLYPYAHLWLTFNAPTSYVARAYHAGLYPPGTENMQLMQEVLKNMLEAHVQTYHALKKIAPAATIGIGHNIYQVEPKNFWDIPGCATANTLFHENFYRFFRTGDFKVSVPFKANVKHYNDAASRSLDFIGLSYYSHGLMSGFDVDAYPGDQKTQMKIYTVYPEGFYRAIQELTKELAQPLNIPIYVTETGIATNNEAQRELFFKRYLFALSYAISTGCPVKGCMVWTLTDNYEWGSYDYNYGLFGINFETLERDKEPRAGAQYFIDVVRGFS